MSKLDPQATSPWRDVFRAVANTLPDGVCVLDRAGRILVANQALASLLGHPSHELERMHLGDLEMRAAPIATGRSRLGVLDGRSTRFHAELRDRDGAAVAVEISMRQVELGGEPLPVAVVRPRVSEAAADDVQRYRALFEQARDAIYVADAGGRLVDANQAMVELLGHARAELADLRLPDLFADAEHAGRFHRELGATGAIRDFETRLRRRTGEEIHVHLSAVSAGDAGYHGVIHDITARKLAEEQLWHAAVHDALTGLPNRTVFLDRLSRSLGRAWRREDYRFAVLFMDLDHFKAVNDSFGHLVGDTVLVAAARRIEASVRPEDTVARIGGDEFAVLLYNVADPSYVQHIAERVQDRLREPLVVDGEREVSLTMSVGIALSSAGYRRPEEVLRDADIAMYRAKERGREQYAFFEPEMGMEAAARIALERDLREAVKRRELRVYYQPVVSVEDQRLSGFEALVRWEHPERGLVQPALFIHVAEEIDLIDQIDEWVLETACEQMVAWGLEFPTADITMNVNMSGKLLLRTDVVPRVDAVLQRTGVDASRLRLEITETVVLSQTEHVARQLTALRERGLRFCIDDFGVGYSSFGYLSRFPVDVLKIDRSFVEGLDVEGNNREIVRAILSLARNLGLEAIAEGAETLDELDSLRELGSRSAQGFLFSRPVEVDVATEMIRAGILSPRFGI